MAYLSGNIKENRKYKKNYDKSTKNLSLLKNGYRYKIRQFQKNGIAFPFYTRDGTDEICQKLSAKYFIEARNQSIEKETKVWIQEYSEQLTQAGLSYPSEVPVFLQKAKQAEQQMKRYNELSEMLTPLFPEELTKRNYL